MTTDKTDKTSTTKTLADLQWDEINRLFRAGEITKAQWYALQEVHTPTGSDWTFKVLSARALVRKGLLRFVEPTGWRYWNADRAPQNYVLTLGMEPEEKERLLAEAERLLEQDGIDWERLLELED